MSKKVLVIGGVALGPKAASRLKRLEPSAHVTMIDENNFISFGGCGIPYYVSGEVNTLEALRSTTYGAVRNPEYFHDFKDIEVLNMTRALSINRKEHTVLVKNLQTGNEQTLSYDKLILGTGSSPKVPPIEGRNLKGVSGANNLEEAGAIRDACSSGKVEHAVVIGGGFIGMEVAVALADMWGIHTSIVEFMPQVMPGVLSSNMADMIAADLKAHNVDVYPAEKVLRLEGQEHVSQVVTDKRVLDADLVIFATGYAPNTQLAQDAGLEVDDKTKGILVNEYMQTSDPDIYAGGDCVAIPNLITGKRFVLALGSLANRQGRVIGTNIASTTGQQSTFAGAVGTWCVKLFKMSACGTGLTIERAQAAGFDAIVAGIEQLDRAHFYPEKHMMALELVVERSTRRVLGIQGVCEDGDALKARIDAVATMLQFSKPTLDDVANAEIAYAPPFASAMDVVNAVANVADNILSGQFTSLTSQEFSALWENRAENNIYFIDARPAGASKPVAEKYPDYWHAIPLEEVKTRFESIPKDRPIALVCNTGLRAYEVMLYLRNHGINDIKNSLGGMQTLLKRGVTF